MIFVGTTQGLANPILDFASGEQASRLDNLALAVNPLRFDRVEPGTLRRQLAGKDADPFLLPFDLTVVSKDPGVNQVADVPARIYLSLIVFNGPVR